MPRWPFKLALRLLALVLAFVIALGLFFSARGLGWLAPFGIVTEGSDSQVVQAIERTQEVSLLKLGIQGIKDRTQTSTIFGQELPWSDETVYLQYSFDAKLGLNGEEVEVARVSENRYRVTLPEFSFIGYSEPTFKVAVEDGGALSFITPEVDQVEMVNEILDDDARANYISGNEDLLEDQARIFYGTLIAGIDPAAEITYVFDS